MADEAGVEPATDRLTADCSIAELLANTLDLSSITQADFND